MKDYEKNQSCSEKSCEFYNCVMELNCSYSEDNSKCIKAVKQQGEFMDMIKCKHGNSGECELCGDIMPTKEQKVILKYHCQSCDAQLNKSFIFCPFCGDKIKWE